MIRTASLRHALNDLRAHHAVAVAQGTADDHGKHLPESIGLDDGSTLWVRNRDASRLADRSSVRIEAGVMLGFFEIIRRGANGKKIGTTTYVP